MSKKVKCLVWDLDNTLWEGTLLEDSDVKLKPGMREILEELDRRGILLSIASKNDHSDAVAKLRHLGVEEYFIYPQINWNSKAQSVKSIAEGINIGIDALAFIDDQSFEREDVKFSCPEVLTIDAADYQKLTEMEEIMPRFITEDSRKRRLMYLSDLQRKSDEGAFEGSNEEFLATLDMKLTIAPVQEGDLERVEELTLRTNQLNSTGFTYDFDELASFITSEKHTFLIAGLDDKYGTYGKIGLVLLEETEGAIEIKLLLMSCRVMTRGIGAALLIHIVKLAQARGKKLRAQFVSTGRNRVMYITYKLMGFEETEASENDNDDGGESKVEILEYRGKADGEYPGYLKVIVE
ncbi:MAG TPA: HAD-IIIC family phosphatase [Syntrophomonas sp.]|nr:HAD-IIIC family phosphatase [Syntrophomonas sp.]